MSDKWYDDRSLLVGLASALVNAEVLSEGPDFSEFMNKPQKYNTTYVAWDMAGFPTSDEDEGWEEFVDAISSDDEDSEEEEE